LLASMVRPGYLDGSDVLLSSLSTSVLRFQDARPIGRKDRDWQSCGVKRTVLRGVAVADATRPWSKWEHHPFRTALMGL
jgi:hypothetical protein